MLRNITQRILLGSMLPVGVVTIMPNIMISDPGTKQTEVASYLGLAASASFCLAGTAGILNRIQVSYGFGIIGLTLQLGALAFMSM